MIIYNNLLAFQNYLQYGIFSSFVRLTAQPRVSFHLYFAMCLNCCSRHAADGRFVQQLFSTVSIHQLWYAGMTDNVLSFLQWELF